MNPRTDQARARQVEMILEQVEALPTLSPVAARLLTLAGADDADLVEIAELIEVDPALSARILALCRRADKGLGDRITTVRRAVTMLGLEAVRTAVLSVSIYDLMNSAPHAGAALDEQSAGEGAASGPAFDRPGFWRHAVAVACASECLARELSGARFTPEEAFVAGLVHDLGKLALELILPRSYARVLALAERRQSDSAPLERAVLGLDHHTAGKRIAEHWRLPDSLKEVLWLHSQPAPSLPPTGNRQLIGLVTLAKAVCKNLHLGWSGDFGPIPDPAALSEPVGLEPGASMGVAEPLARAFAERCELLGLDHAPGHDVLLEAVVNANRQLAKLTSSFQTRSRLASLQSRVLDGVRQFQAAARPGRTVAETLAEVAASAMHLLGPGFCAVLFQPSSVTGEADSPADEPWQLTRYTPPEGAGRGARAAWSRAIEPPPHRQHGRSLAALLDPAQVSMGAVAVLPWLADELADGPDIREIRLLPLVSAEEGLGGPGAVLLHDRDLAELSSGPALLPAVTATWAAAIRSAAHDERASRLSQQLVEVGRSLTEAQGRLTETESLARLGEMTAGAAHEMNNPLAIISGRSQILLTRLENDDDHASAVAIAHAAQDLSDLITSLHLIAEPPPCNPSVHDTSEIATRALHLAAERLKAPARVDVHIAPGAARARVDPDLLAPALAELVVNAVEAAPENVVTLRILADELEDRLEFRVEDQGPGVVSRVRQHAFDAFFSHRPAGRQRGLGLTRARRLVQSHGGEIALANQTTSRGAVATITLTEWRPDTDAAFKVPQADAPVRRPSAA